MTEQDPLDEKYQEKKDKLRCKIALVSGEIDDLKDEAMTEERFWGMLALNDSPAFDYGRDILKEQTMERWMDNNKMLPYKRFPLFADNEWYRSSRSQPIVQVQGVLRSGVPTGSCLKASIKIRESKSDDEEEEEEAAEEKEKEEEQKKKEAKNPYDAAEGSDDFLDEDLVTDEEQEADKDKKKKKKKEPELSLSDSEPSESEEEEVDKNGKKVEKKREKHEQVFETCRKIYKHNKFNIHKPAFLKDLTHDRAGYMVRLYLLTCQNLSATCTQIGVKEAMAGMTALSIANPYPVLQIGAHKTVNERDKYMPMELNPQWFRYYELECHLPEDWRFEIAIWDRSAFAIAD